MVTRGSGREEEYANKHLRPTFKSGRKTVHVWGAFCGAELGPLYILPEGESMIAKWYKYVLQTYMVPFYNRMKAQHGEEVAFMEDNALWHTAKKVQKYLLSKGINRMPQPPQLLDFNLI